MTPKNVRTRVKSSTAITVQWDGLTPCREVNGLIVEYRVQYTAYSSDIMQSVVHPGNWSVQGAQALLSELTPFTNYSIKVAAVNEQGDVGPYSNPMTEQTEEDCELFLEKSFFKITTFSAVPGAVLITTFPSLFKITITWNPPERPNGIIIAYEVSYRQTESSEPFTRLNTTNQDTRFSTQSNLEFGSEFIFSVTVYTKVGPGKATSVTVSTLAMLRENILLL